MKYFILSMLFFAALVEVQATEITGKNLEKLSCSHYINPDENPTLSVTFKENKKNVGTALVTIQERSRYSADDRFLDFVRDQLMLISGDATLVSSNDDNEVEKIVLNKTGNNESVAGKIYFNNKAYELSCIWTR